MVRDPLWRAGSALGDRGSLSGGDPRGSTPFRIPYIQKIAKKSGCAAAMNRARIAHKHASRIHAHTAAAAPANSAAPPAFVASAALAFPVIAVTAPCHCCCFCCCCCYALRIHAHASRIRTRTSRIHAHASRIRPRTRRRASVRAHCTSTRTHRISMRTHRANVRTQFNRILNLFLLQGHIQEGIQHKCHNKALASLCFHLQNASPCLSLTLKHQSCHLR